LVNKSASMFWVGQYALAMILRRAERSNMGSHTPQYNALKCAETHRCQGIYELPAAGKAPCTCGTIQAPFRAVWCSLGIDMCFS
jgi:hypothetical protein